MALLLKLIFHRLTGPIASALCVVLAASLPLTYCTGRSDGVRSEKAAEQKRLEAARKKVAKREAQADKITEKAADKITEQRVRIEYRTKYLTREVVRYVPQAADDRCELPSGFIMLHDAAASGSETGVPSSPGGSVEAPAGIPLSEALGAIVHNYGVGHDYRAEVMGWRAWYKAQLEEWQKR